jgi:hypothetical protein
MGKGRGKHGVKPEELTVRQIVGCLKVSQVAAVCTSVAAIISGAFYLGYKVRAGVYENELAAKSGTVTSLESKLQQTNEDLQDLQRVNEQYKAMFEIQSMVLDYRTRHPEGSAGSSAHNSEAQHRFEVYVLEKSNQFGRDFVDFSGAIRPKDPPTEDIGRYNTGIIRFPFANVRVEVPPALWIRQLE